MANANLQRLITTLNSSGLQQSNNPLYQVIKQLINFLLTFEQSSTTATSSAGSSAAALYLKTYLTATDETGTLPNSRELLAGTNVTFDDSVAGERTINVSGGSANDYVVMSDGGGTPQPLNDGAGHFIYTAYTP